MLAYYFEKSYAILVNNVNYLVLKKFDIIFDFSKNTDFLKGFFEEYFITNLAFYDTRIIEKIISNKGLHKDIKDIINSTNEGNIDNIIYILEKFKYFKGDSKNLSIFIKAFNENGFFTLLKLKDKSVIDFIISEFLFINRGVKFRKIESKTIEKLNTLSLDSIKFLMDRYNKFSYNNLLHISTILNIDQIKFCIDYVEDFSKIIKSADYAGLYNFSLLVTKGVIKEKGKFKDFVEVIKSYKELNGDVLDYLLNKGWNLTHILDKKNKNRYKFESFARKDNSLDDIKIIIESGNIGFNEFVENLDIIARLAPKKISKINFSNILFSKIKRFNNLHHTEKNIKVLGKIQKNNIHIDEEKFSSILDEIFTYTGGLLTYKLLESVCIDGKNIDLALQNFSKNKSKIINSETIKEVDVDEELLLGVYSGGSHNHGLNGITDRSSDLDKYFFNKEGYEFTLSGLFGYKLKKGEKFNNKLFNEYQNIVKVITSIATVEKLSSHIDKLLLEIGHETKSEFIESKIVEYFSYLDKIRSFKKEDLNIIIAYQLLGQIDEFIYGSNDKKSNFTDVDSLNAIQINALLAEYGDSLKDSIKLVKSESIKNGEIAKNMVSDILGSRNVSFKNLLKTSNINSIIDSFTKLPFDFKSEEDLNIIIRKSLLNKFKNYVGYDSELILEIEKNIDNFLIKINSKDFKELRNGTITKLDFINKWELAVNGVFGGYSGVHLNLKSLEKLQNDIYLELKTESDKFEEVIESEEKSNGKEVKKSSRFRKLKGYFSKTRENHLAKGVGGVCINPWDDKNYFEFVMFDQDREVNIGTVMLLTMNDKKGKFLLYAPNPSEEFTSKVSADRLYKKITDIISDFAEKNDYDGVLLDKQHGRATNRAGAFQKALEKSILKNEDSTNKEIELDKHYNLSGGYNYKDLNYVWEK